jgi:thiosulfate/3-mercaptopyruvate sulfurtransferase
MRYSKLVSTGDLARHLDDPAWAVFDCRFDLTAPAQGRREFEQSHIPGAAYLHLDEDLSGAKNGRNGRHPLPQIESLSSKLASAGVGRGSQVVAYDAQGGMVAARLWWLLHGLGHQTVAVLDGGWNAWRAEGRPCAAQCAAQRSSRPASDPAFTTQHDFVDAKFVLERLHDSGTVLVDARAPDRFRGENETLDPVGGRIPGARNRFFRDNLDAQGRFKPAEMLKQEWDAVLSGSPGNRIIHYCGSGVSACHNLLSMEIAGLPGSRLYAGSWSEWCADGARPVAKGAASGAQGRDPDQAASATGVP